MGSCCQEVTYCTSYLEVSLLGFFCFFFSYKHCVLPRGWNRVLGIELHDIATDTNINRLLVEKGLAVSAMAPLKQLLGSPVCDLAAFPG